MKILVLIAFAGALLGCSQAGDPVRGVSGSDDRKPAGLDASGLRLARAGRSDDLLCALAPADARPVPDWLADSPTACRCARDASSCRVVDLRGDRRRALLIPPGDHLHAVIHADAGASLRFAVAAVGVKPTHLDVQVAVRDLSTGATGSWQRQVKVVDRWVEGRIDLGPFAGHDLQVSAVVGPGPLAPAGSMGAIAAPRLAIPAAPGSPPAVSNIIVYLIDALRADRTSAYGYRRPTTPRLAELARTGVLFENAYTVASWTRPSVASLMTSLLPQTHGVGIYTGLPLDATTLAERFRDAGWSTWAFVTNAQVHAKTLNFEQGFDRFVAMDGFPLGQTVRTAELNAALFPQIESFSDEPFVLYVHAIDPHAPYDPPREAGFKFRDPAYNGPIRPHRTQRVILDDQHLDDADVAQIRDLYDEDVRYQDDMLGALLDWMKARGLDRTTLLIVLADHGEELFDRGDWEHGDRLFEEQIRIPLVIHFPGEDRLAGLRVSAPVQIVDLLPSLLRWYGIGPCTGCEGRDLTEVLSPQGQAGAERSIVCQEPRPDLGHDLRSLVDGRWKVIETRAAGPGLAPTVQLFDLQSDRGERHDRAAEEPRLVARLESRLEDAAQLAAGSGSGGTEPAPARIDDATRRQLEALGYVTPASGTAR